MSLVISYLDDHLEYLPQLAGWAFEAWGRYNPSSSLEKAQEKLKTHLNKTTLPLTYIALHDDLPVGMCSLRMNDGIRSDLAPWLGSLYVEPDMRGQGIGEELIRVTTEKARSMGYRKLYLLALDKTLPDWYQKLGWRMISFDELNGHPVSIMEIAL
jgi:N-acetylglutamate synthase-like GNAT family acetyltransferase